MNDLETPPRWTEFVKSSYSGETGCLYVAPRRNFVVLWESSNPFELAHMTKVPKAAFGAFLDGAKAGEFDRFTA